jgi:Bacterial membrane protein YfhO
MRHSVAPFLLPVLVLVVSTAAAAYIVFEIAPAGMFPAHDIYAYSYPKMLYAAESLRAGGKGLLWNPFQNCGQPFFALSQTGLLYPPHWLFLVLAPELALRAVIVVNLIIAGAGIYLLSRALGTSPLAAICGMLVFQLGTTLPLFSTAALPHLGAYAWLPAALLATERVLDRPGASRAAPLAIVLAIQWLPGSPQVWFLTIQLIVLRLLWALAWSASGRRLRTVGWTVAALALAPALAGVQVVPEVAAASVSLRNSSLAEREANPNGLLTREGVDLELYMRGFNHRAVVPALIPLAVAALALGGRHRRGMFYAVAGVLYGVLAFGPSTPLFDFYLWVPGASLFRFASRLLWVSGFCFAVLTALGVEAIGGPRATPAYASRLFALALLGVGFAVANVVVPEGLFPRERWVAACAAVAAVALIWRAAFWPLAQAAIVAAVAIILVMFPGTAPQSLLSDSPGYEARRQVMDALERRRSPQDRVYPVSRRGDVIDFSLIPKSASLFRAPSATDYEPLLSARFAEFAVRMRAGHLLANRNEAIYMAELGAGSSRRLLDLTATRYLIVDRSDATALAGMRPPLSPLLTVGETQVLENPSALPRAFFVPRIAIVADSRALLQRLAAGQDDLRSVALVEAAPSDFTGLPGDGSGADVHFITDDPEHVELAVEAPARGFLMLSDQYDAGWRAWVDGKPASIVRGNYAFRLVEVPAGRSIVEFRYRPTSLFVGAGVSVLAMAALALAVRRDGADQDRSR